MVKEAIKAWLNEGRWVWRTAPWWAFAGWLLVTIVLGLLLGALMAGAVSCACVLLGGCWSGGHQRQHVKAGFEIYGIPLVTVAEVTSESAGNEAIRAGARVSGDPGVRVSLFGVRGGGRGDADGL